MAGIDSKDNKVPEYSIKPILYRAGEDGWKTTIPEGMNTNVPGLYRAMKEGKIKVHGDGVKPASAETKPNPDCLDKKVEEYQ